MKAGGEAGRGPRRSSRYSARPCDDVRGTCVHTALPRRGGCLPQFRVQVTKTGAAGETGSEQEVTGEKTHAMCVCTWCVCTWCVYVVCVCLGCGCVWCVCTWCAFACGVCVHVVCVCARGVCTRGVCVHGVCTWCVCAWCVHVVRVRVVCVCTWCVCAWCVCAWYAHMCGCVCVQREHNPVTMANTAHTWAGVVTSRPGHRTWSEVSRLWPHGRSPPGAVSDCVTHLADDPMSS